MKQLKMLWRSRETSFPENPWKGFDYRPSTGSAEDIRSWVEICKHGLLPPEAGEDSYRDLLVNWKDYRTSDTWFVEREGTPVATVTAIVHPETRRGYVHMVAASPECRGQGVGGLMNRIACAVFWEAGCEAADLTTDDFRIPAIRSYLSAGFLPVDWDEDMTGRWEAILRELGRSRVEMVDEDGRPVRLLLP